jgi:phenylalanine-4-hydroxylase
MKDWVIEQGWDHYSAAEHATWKTLFEHSGFSAFI